jgi:hypothetical protein
LIPVVAKARIDSRTSLLPRADRLAAKPATAKNRVFVS